MSNTTSSENARAKIGSFICLPENVGTLGTHDLLIPYETYSDELFLLGDTFMGYRYYFYTGKTLQLVPKTAIIEFDNYPLPLENAGGE